MQYRDGLVVGMEIVRRGGEFLRRRQRVRAPTRAVVLDDDRPVRHQVTQSGVHRLPIAPCRGAQTVARYRPASQEQRNDDIFRPRPRRPSRHVQNATEYVTSAGPAANPVVWSVEKKSSESPSSSMFRVRYAPVASPAMEPTPTALH